MSGKIPKAMLVFRRAFENSLSVGSDVPPAPGIEIKTVEDILRKIVLFECSDHAQSPALLEEEVIYLIKGVVSYFAGKSALVEVSGSFIVAGDTHGQLSDVFRLLRRGPFPPKASYMFLGDYVDRGPFSVETVCLMFAYKLRYPDRFHILRGNHETWQINMIYGFSAECAAKYGARGSNIWSEFQVAFNSLPITGLINNQVLCMHGGLSPHFVSLDQLRKMPLPFGVPEAGGGLVNDLLWSDPYPNIKGFVPNMRGVSFRFGEDVVKEFVEKHNLALIARAHQVVVDGFEFFADCKLITLFSAPNYGGQFNNHGAALRISENMKWSIFKIPPKSHETKGNLSASMSQQQALSKT